MHRKTAAIATAHSRTNPSRSARTASSWLVRSTDNPSWSTVRLAALGALTLLSALTIGVHKSGSKGFNYEIVKNLVAGTLTVTCKK